MLDFERSARFAGVPLKIPAKFPIPTAERGAPVLVAAAARRPDREPLGPPLPARFFARGVDLSDPVALKTLCAEFGLDRTKPSRSGTIPTGRRT
jgi:2-hydroxychromene-2-carboxylate isomerase